MVLQQRSVREALAALLTPRSVAVIGASTQRESVGRAVFKNILFHGYTGIVYPVNPKAPSILGVKAYPSVLDIPDAIDLAVVIVPAAVVSRVLDECGRKGVKGAIVISAGFKEIGPEGAKLEAELQEVVQRYGMALVGPNCLGIINSDPAVSLNATFARSMPQAGNIAFISQSGALGVAALEHVEQEHIGLSKFISVGNKADIDENDLLETLKDDPQTDVILLYVEGLEDPKRFHDLATQITGDLPLKKPILAVKSGRTREGAQAASSHTGALAGSDEVYDSLFFQSGVLRVETMGELFDYAKAFANQPLPQGDRVAIVTNAGGPGIMATDACVRYGLKIAAFSAQTEGQLRQSLPPTANIHNPVDVIGDAREDRYELALKSVLADENVDGAIVICTPQMMIDLRDVARTIVQTAPSARKPILACFMATGDIAAAVKILEEARIPHYEFPEEAARSLAAMARYAWWINRPRTEIKHFADAHKPTVTRIIARTRQQKRSFLPEPEAHAVLKAYGLPTMKSELARNEEEAVQIAGVIGYPVVLKIVSPDIVHKTDVGGVALNLASEAELRKAHQELLRSVKTALPHAQLQGVLVAEMLKGGVETILGMKRDPHFGPLLMFGLGGIYVEALKDVTFRIAPIRVLGAYRMIQQIRSYKILEGIRGKPPADIDAIAECLERLSQLVMDFEEIAELDINPLIVYPQGQGARVVDARILIRSS